MASSSRIYLASEPDGVQGPFGVMVSDVNHNEKGEDSQRRILYRIGLMWAALHAWMQGKHF